MKIYTKKGDQGETCLVSGEKVPKSHLRLESYGTLDELNSMIGWGVSLITKNSRKNELEKYLKEILFEIQNHLFNLGSQLACIDGKMATRLPGITADDVTRMEKKIDELETHLPPLKNFILPGGAETSSVFHVARTICRRAERICIRLREDSAIPELAIPYLNRLSDLLFVIARFCNKTENQAEVTWKKE
jgi:cob(I)alamin adenosyltransferase